MLTLFPGLAPPQPPDSIDLRCCSVEQIIGDGKGAKLVMADPPWRYERDAGGANPEMNGIYSGMSEAEIAEVIAAAGKVAAPGARLACWATWPKMVEFLAHSVAPWRYATGGAWHKSNHVGVGYHWRGATEPVLLYRKDGTSGRPSSLVLSGHVSPPEQHSRKPVAWMRTWIEAWTEPGDLVLDLWSGTAPVATACAQTGRRYLGAEIDPDRHQAALAMIAATLQETSC